MTGVSLFLGYNLYQARVKIANLSAIKQPASETEQLSWKTSYQDNKLLLTIKGKTNEREGQPDEICVLSLAGNKEYYLNGNQKINKNNCEEPSIVIPKQDNTWNFEHTFKNQKYRTIRVEKIYKNNRAPKSYIDFTIKNNN